MTLHGKRPGTLSNKIWKAVGDKEVTKCWTLSSGFAIVKKVKTSRGLSAVTPETPLLSLMQLAAERYFLPSREREEEVFEDDDEVPDIASSLRFLTDQLLTVRKFYLRK